MKWCVLTPKCNRIFSQALQNSVLVMALELPEWGLQEAVPTPPPGFSQTQLGQFRDRQNLKSRCKLKADLVAIVRADPKL